MSNATRPRRRWFQFSLKTLILSVLATGSIAGWLAIEFNKARMQQAAAKAIAELPHCRSYAVFESPNAAKQRTGFPLRLVRWCLGEDYARNVILVSVNAIAPKRGGTWAPVGDKELAPIRRFPELRFLELSDTNAGNHGLPFLRGCGKLKVLRIYGSLLDDQGMASLAGLERLEDLLLASPHVTDAGLVQLRNLRRLKTLNLACARVGSKGLAQLTGLAELESLRLSGMQISEAGLEHIALLSPLRQLDLREARVEGAGLAHLDRLPNLAVLLLDNSALDDDGLLQLRTGPSLKRLDLTGAAISDAGLARLGRVAGLEWLNLSNTKVSDAGLAALARLPRLKYLDLAGTQVTDAGIAALNDVPSLVAVDLFETKVSETGVMSLKASGGIEHAYSILVRELNELTEFDFLNTPLADVVDYLKTRHDVEIQLDLKALTRLGVSFGAPVTKKLSGVTLAKALDEIFARLGLMHVVRHEVLLITSDPPPPKFRIPQLVGTTKLPEPIATALDDKTEVDYVDTPLTDALVYLAMRHEVSIKVDSEAFLKAGRSADLPITRNLHGIALRSALELILDAEDLTCIVDGDSLVIRPQPTESPAAEQPPTANP